MNMGKSRDLFDDTTMSFGEHLEALRVHLWKAIIGIIICVIFCLFFGKNIIDIVKRPIDAALDDHGLIEQAQNDMEFDLWETMSDWFSDKPKKKPQDPTPEPSADEPKTYTIQLSANALAGALHELDADRYPPPAKKDDGKTQLTLTVMIPELAELQPTGASNDTLKPITLNVQEAFLTYLKVSFVSGFVMASPWVFYQLWLFVAAGLYPHERRYVHVYLPFSLCLFLAGATFCFTLVFPFVLDFLLSFNKTLEVTPQIRLSEWITFAIMLPLMFGLSFQLPLVMLLLERLSIFEVVDYRTKRRMAILIIAIVSMFMTPADPMSMLLMMLPLICLYELGVLLCGFNPQKSPFEPEPV